MLTTIAMFSYFAGSILDLIAELQKKDTYRQQILSELNIYSDVNEIDDEQRKRIKFYV